MSGPPRSDPERHARDADLGRLVVDDLRHTELRRDYLDDLRRLYLFYLDDDERARLDEMNRVRRAISLLFWILKSLLLKLSPARRLMLLVSGLLMFFGENDVRLFDMRLDADLRPWGFVILLLVLMLELRDKLLAKDEIQVARQVQLALLPDRHPTIPGWDVWSHSQPANDVGGDLVDYVDIDGFRHGVLLGDVAGKGLGAALLTAKLQATLRALLPDAVAMDELAQRVNTILFRDGLDNRYATVFYTELEHHSGRLRYINAGHNPPYVVRGGELHELPASSFPLGMLGSAKYEEGLVELAPDEVLFIYSDGLTEAESPSGEEYGVARLSDLLRRIEPGGSAESIGRRVLDEVNAFLEGGRSGDDLSVIVLVRRNGRTG